MQTEYQLRLKDLHMQVGLIAVCVSFVCVCVWGGWVGVLEDVPVWVATAPNTHTIHRTL